ncbi:MAG: GAF domain-containing protein, partial [Caldilineaceae bacterium]|nr:GAF domain-containing protein [Caldilineaceae bacterium]
MSQSDTRILLLDDDDESSRHSPEHSTSDSQRDAEKYRQLVLALRHASKQLRTLETQGQVNAEAALGEMLPDIATAFQAQVAFLVRSSPWESSQESNMTLIRTHPADVIHGAFVPGNPLLAEVLATNQARILDTLDGERTEPIQGLEFCDATSAILVPVHLLEHHYVVGICNKIDHTSGPFLASDRMTLANLLELVAVGGRAGERRRRELESIEQISKIATIGSPQAVADAIVRQAVTVTQSRYAALWTLNKHSVQMEFFTMYHAHDPQWQPPHLTLDLDDTSFISFAAANNTIIHVQDIEELDLDLGERYLRWDPETRSALCIPLSFHEQHVLGVLYVAGAVAAGITTERRRFLEQLAPHAAIALHNTRLREIRQQVIHFQHDVSDVMPLNRQLDQILDHLRRRVDISGLFLAMYNAESDEITFPLAFDHGQAVGRPEKQPGTFYGPRTPGRQRLGFVEWVLQYRETLLVENFPTWPQRHSIDPTDRRDVKSCLVVPLIRQERVVGAIGLRSYFAARGNFDEYDRRFLEGV